MEPLRPINLDIARKLQGKAYRGEFFAARTCDEIAGQIRAMRKRRGMTQRRLATHTGTSQTVIARAESAAYIGWNVRTLLRIARALDCRIKITFEPCEDALREFEDPISK